MLHEAVNIRRVRDAHEGTIENDSQLAHVRQCSARAPSVPSRTADDIHDRALGAFLGLAVGDAVSTTLEFSCSSPRSRFEPAVRTPGGPVARHPQPRGRKPVLRREYPGFCAGFQGRLSC